MRNKKFKKIQSQLNRYVKNVNKNIENDELWLGRFYMTQADSNWYEFEDGSGGELFATLVCVDKKDSTLYPWRGSFLYGYPLTPGQLFLFMNKFITEITDTYKNGNNPYKDEKLDYRNKPRIKFTHEQLRDAPCWYHGI